MEVVLVQTIVEFTQHHEISGEHRGLFAPAHIPCLQQMEGFQMNPHAGNYALAGLTASLTQYEEVSRHIIRGLTCWAWWGSR